MTASDGFEVPLPDLEAVAALGRALARVLRSGDVLALEGDLGSGKTALARAVVQAWLGPEEEVPSPTFTLVQTYDIPSGLVAWHFDLYRLNHPEEAVELGLEEALAEGIVMMEWPERLGPLLPAHRLVVSLTLAGTGEARLAQVRGIGGGRLRLAELQQAMAEER
ncbi:MAG: tRNA (adenosine(37)-N6)-threonylcarbamoyltransferase complex ATPase subunit type 1 TsaE [Alphaproteobacteria bacterium]